MLKIRLQRVGRKNNPSFRVVLTDSKNSTKSGKFHEVLGHFDFRKDTENTIKGDRVKYWMSQGAQVTPTVHNYLLSQKIVTGKKINVLPRKSPPVKEADAAAAGGAKAAPAANVPASESPAAQAPEATPAAEPVTAAAAAEAPKA